MGKSWKYMYEWPDSGRETGTLSLCSCETSNKYDTGPHYSDISLSSATNVCTALVFISNNAKMLGKCIRFVRRWEVQLLHLLIAHLEIYFFFSYVHESQVWKRCIIRLLLFYSSLGYNWINRYLFFMHCAWYLITIIFRRAWNFFLQYLHWMR